MADDDRTALAGRLGVGVEDLAFLDRVDGPAVARLRAAVDDAWQREEQALADAFEGTVRLVPRPLRGRIRRLLTGGGA